MDKEKQIIEIKECIDEIYGADCAYYGVDGFAIANEIYEANYRKQEWISVDDRLPRESEVVLAYSVKFGIIQRIYTSYIGEVRWWSHGCWNSTEQLRITHWMPLPEPPETKGETE